MGALEELFAQAAAQAVEKALEKKVVSRAEDPGVVRDGDDKVTAILPPGAQIGDLQALLERRGLDPTDWTVERVTVNEWESAAVIDGQWVNVTLHQLKANLLPSAARRLGILPARTDGPIYTPSGRYQQVKQTGAERLYAVLPDQQAPHHDKALHELVCRWLDTNRPYGINISGDAIDLPTLSRHRHNPVMVKERDKALNDGITATHGVLRDYRQADPDAEDLDYEPGNHEQRFVNYLIENAFELYGIKRAGDIDEESVLSLPFLLRLDELGYNWVRASDGAEWPDAELVLSPHLAIRHGWLAKKGSGASALATLESLGYSVIVGHTHRQSIVFKTIRQITGERRVLTAVEAGSLCERQHGLGYAGTNADWQQGFAVVRLFEDGTFDASLAKYVNNTLIWEGQRYEDRGPLGVKVAA